MGAFTPGSIATEPREPRSQLPSVCRENTTDQAAAAKRLLPGNGKGKKSPVNNKDCTVSCILCLATLKVSSRPLYNLFASLKKRKEKVNCVFLCSLESCNPFSYLNVNEAFHLLIASEPAPHSLLVS